MKHTNTPGLNSQKILNGAIIFLIIIALLLFGYYLLTENKSETITHNKETKSHTQLNINKQELFPTLNSEFNFETVHGTNINIQASDKQFKIKGMEEKLVFLKIFGWDCKYCKKEIPELIKLKRDLGDTFEVVAIEAQHASKEESLKQMEELGINYHIIAGDQYPRFQNYLKAHYGWSGNIIPLTIVLNKQGNILAFEAGAKSYSLAELIKASLTRDKNGQ
ncbi:MAG: TlpA family protein disulfide reductase [Epsilonproteobacteria bacterium]|nr:TlpA family protein disulfide reductase [Campylobacterota bacterium]